MEVYLPGDICSSYGKIFELKGMTRSGAHIYFLGVKRENISLFLSHSIHYQNIKLCPGQKKCENYSPSHIGIKFINYQLSKVFKQRFEPNFPILLFSFRLD